jgi:hypothetical protein
MKTRIIRIQGIPARVPDGMFTQANTGPGPFCETTEPNWPDGCGGTVVCCLPRHESGPYGQAHIANNAGWPSGDVIAIWQDTPAIPADYDED